jgi:hypothetical protein
MLSHVTVKDKQKTYCRWGKGGGSDALICICIVSAEDPLCCCGSSSRLQLPRFFRWQTQELIVRQFSHGLELNALARKDVWINIFMTSRRTKSRIFSYIGCAECFDEMLLDLKRN